MEPLWEETNGNEYIVTRQEGIASSLVISLGQDATNTEDFYPLFPIYTAFHT